ncbi:probable serine/threonine-protein kinase drkB [Orbicella faveolata]|uniref:probable serine/threonine-protein kinase drkB n=1 Tax=Orbicella faveolata TaxID=48498 RepID=UPI0009E5B9A7|nr:probable serine/threonine-protein kinase drkB [Orbicella faveolata]
MASIKCIITGAKRLQEELKLQKQSKEEAERRVVNLERELRAKEERIIDLEKMLSAAQQKLNEYGLKEPCHWVISRDEIHLTDTCLGVGGWGTVILGRFRGCKVAVKQFHEMIISPHNRRLFEREMNIASRCRHPCLLQFIGATDDEGSPLFVTELMESSLRALLHKQSLSHAEISVISLDVTQALNYLHKSEPPIIHRDISSANVLLWGHGNQWRGKVSDYGAANVMRESKTVGPGAPNYSSPEASTRNQTVKMDVYSYGVLLCEMCNRELPDLKRREEQVALVTDPFFLDLILRCINYEPEARPTMEEIINVLDPQ